MAKKIEQNNLNNKGCGLKRGGHLADDELTGTVGRAEGEAVTTVGVGILVGVGVLVGVGPKTIVGVGKAMGLVVFTTGKAAFSSCFCLLRIKMNKSTTTTSAVITPMINSSNS